MLEARFHHRDSQFNTAATGLFRGGDCVLDIVGSDNFVIVTLERRSHELNNRTLASDQQDHFAVAAKVGSLLESSRLDRQSGGKVNLEASSFANFALDCDETLVRLNDVSNGRQAQAGPLPCFLGAEKRAENLAEIFGRYPATVVVDLQENKPDGRFELFTGFGRICASLFLQNDAHFTALRHGITSIDTQIEQHLMELRFVAVGSSHIRFDVKLEVDIARKRSLQEGKRLFAELLQHDERLDVSAALCEGDDLLNKVGALED